MDMEMESPPHKRNVGRDEDRISVLTDDLLLVILERLDLHESVRAGVLSMRWRHLPHRLSRLRLDAFDFRRATLLESMDAFTGAARSLLAERECHCNSNRAIKSLTLCFLMTAAHHLSSIGGAVEGVVRSGKTKRLFFSIGSPYKKNTTVVQFGEFGQQFMSFSRAYPVAFTWLTRLTLYNLAIGHSDVTDLISACHRLKRLSLKYCKLVDENSPLKIDTPCSRLHELKFFYFRCKQIELISVPNLRKVHIEYFESPPVCFGYVPKLHDVRLGSDAGARLAPFALSDCLSRAARNMSTLYLDFYHQMIWIKPEHPKQLTFIFRNLTHVYLLGIFPECDLSWTLFILEAAPALRMFTLSRSRLCAKEDNAQKTNVVWGPSKDFKHFNLKWQLIRGFKEEDKVTNYIRLVMERAVGLKKIVLLGELSCKNCIDCERKSQVDKASRRRVKEQLAHGSSSSLEIIIR